METPLIPPSSRPALTGSSQDVRLALMLVSGARHTGTLRFDGGRVGAVAIDGGALTSVATGFGRTLREAVGAAVTDDAWALAAATADEPGASPDGPPDEGAVAAALVATDDVPAERVRAAVVDVAVNLLFELLVLADVTFEFVVGDGHPLAPHVAVPVAEVLDAVGARIEDWKAIATEIPSTAAVPRLLPVLAPTADGLALSPTDWRVVVAVDGRRSVADLTAATGLDAFDVCLSLHTLLGAGAVAIALDEAPGEGPGEPA